MGASSPVKNTDKKALDHYKIALCADDVPPNIGMCPIHVDRVAYM